MRIYGLEYEYHPAVKSWRLFRNGNVHLESAAVEFSSSGPESSPSSTQSGSSTFHEGEVSLSPGAETAQSGSKTVGKGEGDLDRLEGMPEYTFRALDFSGDPAPASRTESSLQEVRYPGAKHAVCVGEFSDGTYLYRAGVIIGGVFGGQYTKESKHYIRTGYYDGAKCRYKQSRLAGCLRRNSIGLSYEETKPIVA